MKGVTYRHLHWPVSTVASPDDGHTVARNTYRKEINILGKILHQVRFIYKMFVAQKIQFRGACYVSGRLNQSERTLNLNSMYRFSPYRAVNTLHLSYKINQVNVV